MTRRKGIVGLDTEAFELLSRQVKAQEEENRIQQAAINAAKIRERLYTDVIERYANLGEQIRSLPDIINSIAARLQTLESALNDNGTVAVELRSYASVLHSYESVLREVTEELSNRYDAFEIELSRRIGRLEDIETARLAGDVINPTDAVNWLSGLSAERKRRELRQHYMNLHEFREQSAKYGLSVPIHIINEIAFAEGRIAELEAELNAGSKQS